MEQKKYRIITIEPVLNGFVCNIGCQRAVYRDVVEMLADLNAYYADPEGTSKQFLENTLVLGDIAVPAPYPPATGQTEPAGSGPNY
jgi:hypothetical protein